MEWLEKLEMAIKKGCTRSAKANPTDFDVIRYILNYGYKIDEEDEKLREKDEIHSVGGTFEDYIKWVENIIEEKGLEKNIKITIGRKSSSGKITNSNSEILIEDLLFLEPQGYKGRLIGHPFSFGTITFKNNTFDFKRYSYINFFSRNKINFENNLFKEVNIVLNFISIQAIELIGNIFEKCSLQIRTIFKNRKHNVGSHGFGDWYVSGDVIDKFLNAKYMDNSLSRRINFEEKENPYISKEDYNNYTDLIKKIKRLPGEFPQECSIKDLLQYLYYESNRFTVKVDDVKPKNISGSVLIKDNKILMLRITANILIHFSGKNNIDSLYFDMFDDAYTKQNIIWGPYQKINHRQGSARQHRKIFIDLKKVAIENNDKMQEIILNREILKCDHYLIKLEPPWRSFQDRIILGFGKWSSDHGVALFRPVFLLLAVNALITTIAMLIFSFPVEYNYADFLGWLNIDISQWRVTWGRMLDPRSHLAVSLTIEGGFIVESLNAIQKLFFALLTYESIRVGRRFVAK